MAEQVDQSKWASMMAEFATGYGESEVYEGRWEPALGPEYMAVVSRVVRGDNKGVPWWAIEVKLADGMDPKTQQPYAGKAFRPFFFSAEKKRAGFLKGFIKTVTGRVTNSLAEDDQLLDATVGTILKIVGKAGAKGSKWYVQSVHQPAPAAAKP